MALVALSGCASDYVARTQNVRQAYESGDHVVALQRLVELEKDGSRKDRLLVLLDKGMLQHAQGQYADSVRTLTEAERLADELDVISVSEEAGTLLSNERERAYRGEDFEKLMINVLQALNYAQLGKDEAALVEVRRVHLRLDRMVSEEKKPYEQLAIARYLGGVLWEDQGNADSAFIDYYKAWELNPSLGHLAGPLLRLAEKTGRKDAFKELRAAFPDADHSPLKPGEGEVVVVVETGLSPEKVPMEVPYDGPGVDRSARVNLIAVPSFRDRWAEGTTTVRVGPERQTAVTVTSIESVAKQHLDDRVGRAMARSVASVALKAGIAAGAGAVSRSEALGALTFLLLNQANEADLRSWLSLPAEFQVARFRLLAGEYPVTVDSGATGDAKVQVRPGRVSLVVMRVY